MRSRLALLAATTALAGCNGYEMFSIAGYEQASFSNEADIFFIIDNSTSMEDEASALALNFNAFLETLTSVEEGSALVTGGLSDAVENYIAYTNQRGRYLDYQLGITTTSADYGGGATGDVDPGEAGLLLGDPTVITDDNPEVESAFLKNLLCEATCFAETDLPSDPAFECPADPADADPGGTVTLEFLDCVCGGPGTWEDHCGAGTEEHLEASLMAMCRSVEDPPEGCYENVSAFREGDEMSNPDIVREESTVVFVVVSDEGDTSRRLQQGDEDPAPYLDALADFDRRVRFAVIGPPYDPDTKAMVCNSGGATTWGTERLQIAAEQTAGFYNDIALDSGSGCEVSDFAVHLEDLGKLLNNLTNSFPLRTVPDVSTLQVYVDAALVAESPVVDGEEGTADAVYGDGWSYSSADNAVTFWGDAIPDYNEDVRIYYRPLEGNPRPLPF